VAGDVIAGDELSYDPGIWYNSAKFLNLEYQTYGQVNRRVPGEQNSYWEHADGFHAVRIVHLDARVIGFNFMGMRARHRVCEQWIRDGGELEYVLSHLEECHFDPEFFNRHENEIRSGLRATQSVAS